MRNKIFKLAGLATASLLTCAAMLPADTSFVQFGAGYRQDSITLNIKERGTVNPHAKSSRHFKDLEIVLLDLQLKQTFGCSDAYARASLDYGFVVDGKVRDQLSIEDRGDLCQFNNSGYTVEGEYLYTVAHNRTKKSSYVWDLDVALAYPIQCGCQEFNIAPAIGFTYNRQHLKVRDHFSSDSSCSGRDHSSTTRNHSSTTRNHSSTSSSTTSAFSSSSSSDDDNGSNFRANWWGPWLGFDFAYNSTNCWNMYGAFEFHFGRARRIANSHTNRDYVDDYSRTKTFYGPLFRIGTFYMFCENWYVDANIVYQKFFSDTNRDNISWASGSVRVDVGYVF